ncbi:relaxase/mobilization nuclease domain-containing protein [Listeria monocytogenes]|nr:relaxase/mobilization nuclease domain-containing protein [Listeria monocytogenes]EIZ6653599.1 relaxase/mobilization nuclease domain-containing protein [Listeria monocytogenes]HDT8000317.1 relaxase/mobilization nuclease domain-containing protein [Enterococcus faecalis]HDT8188121.1 relaxase/mobilization nuclease domain-containing protein [Enterococcus faecalis]
MAVTKIHAIKKTPKLAIDYITNPEKTDGQLLVSSYNCQANYASSEMEMTRDFAREVKGDYRKTGGADNLAYHLIQSFSPDDNVTPEQAHELGRQLADELLEGKHEYVISTHIDKGHVHNHIIFNSVSFYDLKKFRSQPYRTANKIKEISNRICAENDLSISPRKTALKDSYTAYRERRKNTSYRAEIRKRLNMILNESSTLEEVKEKATSLGIDIEDTKKHISYSLVEEGQQRRTRGKSLDDIGTYTHEGLNERLEKNKLGLSLLKEAIEDVYSVSDNAEDMAELLRIQYEIEVKTNKSGHTTFKLETLDDFVIHEELLPTSYHLQSIDGNFRSDYTFSDEKHLLSIQERYREKEKSKVEQEDTAVVLFNHQIEKITSEGILVNVNSWETDGTVFIPNNYVDVNTQTDEYTVWIGDKFDYTLFEDDNITSNIKNKKVIKGEGIIRALESAQGKNPEWLDVAGKNISRISERGVTLTFPEQGIERLFIPIEYVQYDTISRSCKVAISDNWNYYGKPVASADMTEQEQKKIPSVRFKGRQIQQALQNEEPRLDIQIQSKMKMLQGRMKKLRTEELIGTLNTIREEGLNNPKQLTERLNEVKQEATLAKEKIVAAEKKLETLSQLSKLLVIYNKYLPTAKQVENAGFLQKKRLETKFQKELSEFKRAEELLQKSNNLRDDLPSEKVIALFKNQQQQLKRLTDSLKHYDSKLEQLDHVRLVVEELSQETESLTVTKEPKRKLSLDEKVQQAKKQAEEQNKQRQGQKNAPNKGFDR